MNSANKNIIQKLATSLGAVYDLADRGCTVMDIAIHDGRPMITIDAPPKQVLPGTARVTRFSNGMRSAVTEALVRDCRVLWSESAGD
jgi:hypothetical protein